MRPGSDIDSVRQRTRTMLRSIRLWLAGACLAGGLAAAGTATAQTPFYVPSPQELAGPPGTLIRQEPMFGAPLGAKAFRILYRSTGLNGETIPVSGVLITPDSPPPAGGRPIVAWAHPTTGAVPHCAPSLAMNFFRRVQGLEAMLAENYAIVATDYPGLGTTEPHPYLVGLSEGRAVLDSVRAVSQAPGVGGSKRFVVWGHSQGGHAALYTGILARQYAPELQIVGVAAAAPATDLATLMRDDINSPGGKNLTALALWSWSRVFNAPLDRVVDPGAIPTVDRLAQQCTETVVDVLIRLDWERPLQKDFLSVPDVTRVQPWQGITTRNSPGPVPRAIPVFIAQGTADKTVRPEVTRAYVSRLCHQGSRVETVWVPNEGHAFIARDTANTAVGWMAARFAGQPAPSTCGG